MTMTSSPPMRTSPLANTVSSGLKVRLASLYGSLMRSTSCTPSSISISRGSTLPLPTTPSTVRDAPVERCTSMPSSTRWAMTFSTCASLARSFITTTIRCTPHGRSAYVRLRDVPDPRCAVAAAYAPTPAPRSHPAPAGSGSSLASIRWIRRASSMMRSYSRPIACSSSGPPSLMFSSLTRAITAASRCGS